MTQMVWNRGYFDGSRKGQIISTVRPSKNIYRKNARYMRFLNLVKIILIGGITIVLTMITLGI
jgi:hypothetical protein